MHRDARILLVRLSAMGDVLQSLTALATLRHARPDATIGWLVEDRHADLLRGHPHVDELFIYRRRDLRGGGALAVLRKLRRELRAFAPDVAVDLQGNLKGALLSRLSGAPRRIGLPPGEAREGAHLAATETVAAGAVREHRSDRALRLVAPLLEGATPKATPTLAPLPDGVAERVAGELAGFDRPPALLVPGTSEFGRFKRWPAPAFGRLAVRLRDELGLPVCVTAGPGEDELADAVVQASDGAAVRAPATGSLHDLRALFEQAAVVVGADSGPVLLSALTGTPTVALFGPKDPLVYGPLGPRAAAVWKRVYCSPCALRRCPDPICMSELTPDEVWPTVLRVLQTAQEDAA